MSLKITKASYFVGQTGIRNLLLLFLLAMSVLSGHAQAVYTLDSCKAMAARDNLTVQNQRLAVEAARQQKMEVFTKFFPSVSAMGAGGKMDPTQVRVAPIEKTYQCRLAHTIRKRLHKMGVRSGFTAVFSPEPVREGSVRIDADPEINKLSTVGTISYMPAVFGCTCASVVIRDVVDGKTW